MKNTHKLWKVSIKRNIKIIEMDKICKFIIHVTGNIRKVNGHRILYSEKDKFYIKYRLTNVCIETDQEIVLIIDLRCGKKFNYSFSEVKNCAIRAIYWSSAVCNVHVKYFSLFIFVSI